MAIGWQQNWSLFTERKNRQKLEETNSDRLPAVSAVKGGSTALIQWGLNKGKLYQTFNSLFVCGWIKKPPNLSFMLLYLHGADQERRLQNIISTILSLHLKHTSRTTSPTRIMVSCAWGTKPAQTETTQIQATCAQCDWPTRTADLIRFYIHMLEYRNWFGVSLAKFQLDLID